MTSGGAAMRTFVAIELNEACRQALGRAIDVLRPVAPGVRWVRPDAIHLTIKFIGELPETDLPAAIDCLDAAAEGVGPFTMVLSGLSGFPPKGTPRVIHVGVDEPTGGLAALQKAVDRGFSRDLRIARDRRRFTPHITLGRVRDRRRCPSVDELSTALTDQDFGSVDVDSFVLMLSELKPTGAVHTPLHRVAFSSPVQNGPA